MSRVGRGALWPSSKVTSLDVPKFLTCFCLLQGIFGRRRKITSHDGCLLLVPVVFGVFNEEKDPCVVDFANKRLGGGWLGYGMAQEEHR